MQIELGKSAPGSSQWRCSVKNGFLKNLQISQLLSCKICEIFKNIYFEEHLRTTAFVNQNSKFQPSLLKYYPMVPKWIYFGLIDCFSFKSKSGYWWRHHKLQKDDVILESFFKKSSCVFLRWKFLLVGC